MKQPDYVGMADIFVEAATELGYPKVDLNGNYTDGGYPSIVFHEKY